MELLGGLMLAGKFISDKNKSINEPIRENKINKIQPNGDNIYSSDYINKTIKSLQNKTQQRYNEANDAENTGIIPLHYNSLKTMKKNVQIDDNDSQFSDEQSMYSNDTTGSSIAIANDQMALLKRSNLVTNNKYFENRIKKPSDARHISNDKETFQSQFDDMRFDSAKPVSSNAVGTLDNNYKMNQISRDLELKGQYSSYNQDNMTYGFIEPDQFVHNNMVPHVRGKTYGGNDNIEGQMNSLKSRKMELFTGSANNVAYKPKTERKPLFNPIVGLSNINGMPNFTDYYESRYIPSKERRNEKPFQPLKVTPGLNLGFNQVGKGGLQDPYRNLPKTIDELRPLNKQQESHTLPTIMGFKGQEGPIAPVIAKRKATTFFELDDPVNKFGDLRAPTINGQYRLDPTAREETSKEYFGGAKSAYDAVLPNFMIAKSKESNKENFMTDRAGQAGVYYVDANKGTAFDMITNIPDINARNMHSLSDRAGQSGAYYVDGNKAPAFDSVNAIPDATMRELYENINRSGNIGNSQQNKNYAFDSLGAVPNTTMRDIYNKFDRAGNFGNTEQSKNYVLDINGAIPETTMRDIHDQSNRIGNVGNAENNKNYVYDIDGMIPENTMRDIHDHYDRAGNFGSGQFSKNYVIDLMNTIPDNTMRDIHNKYDRAGNFGNAQYSKNYVIDLVNAIPENTMRDMHNKYDRAGNFGNGQYNKNYVIDLVNAIPESTLRDMHNKYDRVGNFGSGQYNKNYVIDLINAIPESTLRDIHNKYDRAGQFGNSQFNKSYTFDPINSIPENTLRDIHNKLDRAGNLNSSQYTKGYVFDPVNMIPEHTMRDIHNKFDRAGNIGNDGNYKTYVLDEKGAIPDATMRDIHNEIKIIGGLGGENKAYAFNKFGAVPEVTMRDIHNKVDRAGNILGNVKSYTLDEKGATPDATMRDIHNKTDRAGNIGNGQHYKTYVLDEKGAIPDATMRDIHSDADRAGNISAISQQRYVLDEKGAKPEPTMRDIHGKKTYINPLLGQSKQSSRADANNALLIDKTTLGRAPTTSNYGKGPTMEYTVVKLCEPIQINRELYPDIKFESQENLPIMYTRIPHELPNDELRFHSYIEDNLEKNPYINNTQHRATYPVAK